MRLDFIVLDSPGSADMTVTVLLIGRNGETTSRTD
jgi:hypothetical protein